MVQQVQSPNVHAHIRTTQIGPDRWVIVDRVGYIMAESVNARGFTAYDAPTSDELAAAAQLTWWRSPSNPLADGRIVTRADGMKVRGWLAASTSGAWWLAVQVTDAEGNTLPGLSIIPRRADAAAYVEALLTAAVSTSTSNNVSACA